MKWVYKKWVAGNEILLSFLFFFVATLGIPLFAYSQTLPAFQVPSDLLNQVPDANLLIQETRNEYLKKSVILTADPEHPGPLQNVTMKLSSASSDLTRANISWYVNGRLKDSGIGKTSFTVFTGAIGIQSTVDATVNLVEGVRADKEVVITPAGLYLLWEADSYTPPFYKGKALPTPQSALRVVAMTNFFSGGKQLSPQNLIYLWKNEGTDTRLVDSSGYGKQVLYTSMPLLPRPLAIGVDASSLGGSINATGNLSINPEDPEVLFYENNPLEGVIYENVLGGSHVVNKDDFSVKAEPYYFSTTSRADKKLSYVWSLDGKSVTPDSNEVVTFKRVGNGIGSSLVSLSLRNAANIFQQASASFALNFKNQ